MTKNETVNTLNVKNVNVSRQTVVWISVFVIVKLKGDYNRNYLVLNKA